MRFFVLLFICALPFMAQSAEQNMPLQDDMADIRQVLDTKLFHDRFFVETMIKDLYEQDKAGLYSNPSVMKEMGHEGLFDDRDANLLRYEVANKVVRTQLIQTPWEEQKKAIQKDPFEAFMGLIENQEVPSMAQEDMNDLNSIDKKVIPQTIEMLTESGPDVGAMPVSVIYDESITVR